MKKIVYTLVLVVGCLVSTIAQTTTENYIKTTVYQEGYDQNHIENNFIADDNKIESITYFDGLGRPKQSIAQRAGGNREDLITPILYDDLGRQPKDYLPYPEAGNNGDYVVNPMTPLLAHYYNGYPNGRHNYNINPYSEKRFESSPLNRVLEQGASGGDWKIDPTSDTDHTIKFDYQTNTAAEVKYFEVDFLNNNTRLPQLKSICNKHYAAGQLYKTVTKDENWQPTSGNNHTSEEFTDKLGRVVLKRTYSDDQEHNTYYVYDDFGNLTYVLSPKASDALVGQSKSEEGTTTEQTYLHWTDIVPVDKALADEYALLLQDLDEDPELARQKLVQEYGGYGGIDISLDSDGNVTVVIDITLANPISSASKILYTFASRASNPLPDQKLGTISGTDYEYTIGISNNSVVIDGKGDISQLSQTFTSAQAQQCSLDQEVIDKLAYQYVYDYRNRLVKKKIPEKGWEDIIYDKLDRPILTRDANLKADGKWLFTKYDAFGRVAYTGFYSPSFARTAEELAEDTRLAATAIPLYEEREATPVTINGTTLYYSNSAYPSTDLDLLTINYYDDYGSGTTLAPSSIAVPTNVYGINPRQTNTKSLPTVAKVRVLDTNDWITSVTGYDNKGQAVYGASYNEYLGTTDISESKLDFTGKVEESTMAHTKNGVTITTKDFFTYDHMGRLKIQSQEINNQDREYLVRNTYDAIGQLTNKGVGGTQDPNSPAQISNSLQNVKYDYNIRGWLTGINDGNLLIPSTNYTNLFTFKIRYNQPEKNASTPLYNGNISETYWRTANDAGLAQNKTRGYRYSYDALNRITKANSLGGVSSNSKALSENFTVKDISYDKNGNIQSLKRLGFVDADSQYDLIDNLSYNYNEDSNQLLTVSDSGTVDGFKDGDNRSNDYAYDDNGNLIVDKNKEITSIKYNHLNLPTRVSKDFDAEGYIEFVYDATGVKLEKKVTETNNPNPAITQYAGNYIYENNNLKQVTQPEGYIEQDGNTWQYVYQLKDIWGNTRITYADDDDDGSVSTSEIRREQNFYPYGLEQKGYNINIQGVKNNLKTYQGQEFTEDLGLNTHEWRYRISDPAIGRFWQIDPLAEDYTYNSTYAFQENKMGIGIELEGLEVFNFTEMASNSGPWVKRAAGFTDQILNNANVAVIAYNTAESVSNSLNSIQSGNGTAGDFVNAIAPASGLNAAIGITQTAVSAINGDEAAQGALLGIVVEVAAGEAVVRNSSATTNNSSITATDASVNTSRPSSFRKKTVTNAWDNASDGSTSNTKSCSTCGKDVTGNPNLNETRNTSTGWDASHNPSWSNRNLSKLKSRKDVLDLYNEGVGLECRNCNRSGGNNDTRFNN